MAEPMPRSSTPSLHPKYGVHLSQPAVTAILKHSLERSSLGSISISMLPSDQSFNNRIYFIKCEPSSEEYVLKVNGRFFGASKVNNEGCCLQLVNRFCRDVPAPRLVSYSTGGQSISKWTQQDGIFPTVEECLHLLVEDTPGWILTTRLSGQSLDPIALSPQQRSAVAHQLAKMVMSWRRNIPKALYCGNIDFQQHPGGSISNNKYTPGGGLQDMYIHGLLSTRAHIGAMEGLLGYWNAVFSCEIQLLESKPVFQNTSNRRILPPLLRSFVKDTLLYLPIFSRQAQPTSFPFTHTDFAPRNVLISTSDTGAVTVTGIIDFEFAGLFPPLTEFWPEYTHFARPEGMGYKADGDWPRDMYMEMLTVWRDGGETTPLDIVEGSDEWMELSALNKLECFVAPHVIAKDEETKTAVLALAIEEVKAAIGILRKQADKRRSFG